MRLTEKKGSGASTVSPDPKYYHDLLVSHLYCQADHLIEAALPLFWC